MPASSGLFPSGRREGKANVIRRLFGALFVTYRNPRKITLIEVTGIATIDDLGMCSFASLYVLMGFLAYGAWGDSSVRIGVALTLSVRLQ